MVNRKLMQFIRGIGEVDDNVVRKLDIQAFSENVSIRISQFTGLETEEVFRIVECLRHYESICSYMERQRREDA